MPLLPQDPFALLDLAIIAGGLAFLLARRDVPKAYGIGLLILLLFGIDTLARLNGYLMGAHPLGFRAAQVLEGEAWWAPVTSIFVHAGFAHVFGNLFILVTAGPALEDRVGGRGFLVIFFVAAAAATLAHTGLAYWTDLTSPFATALGASGGIFGILTAFAVRYPRERLPVPLFFIIWVPAFFVLLLYLLFNVGYAVAGETNVAWWGHFAGFLAGLAFAYTLPPAPEQAARPGSARGLPDADKLAPLATTPELKRVLDRLRQFTPETRTHDDAQYADAWLDQFFAHARCPACEERLARRGLSAACPAGDYKVEFGRR